MAIIDLQIKRSIALKKFSVLALLLVFLGCSHTPQPSPEKFQLKVSLYPWIPDQEAFAKWVEAEFERTNPDIDLLVRPMSLSINDNIDLAYDIDKAKAALLFEDAEDSQHMVEIDTMILGALVREKAIRPTSLVRNDHFEFAKKAVTVNDIVYGTPHWTCGYFLMTTHKSVSEAQNSIQLSKSLRELMTPQLDIGGNIAGSWGSIVTYLDAFLDTFPNADVKVALSHTSPEPTVVPYLNAFGNICAANGEAYCNRYGEMEPKFAEGQLDALVGYSERLNPVIKNDKRVINASDIYITPIGAGVM